MTGVKANWHLADLMADDDSDPLDIRTIAKPIDLTGGVAALERELQASLRIENRKFNEGVYCELKLTEDWPTAYTCRTCPQRTEDPGNPLAAICAMSLRQIEIMDQITALRTSSDEEIWAALEEAHGDWAVWEAQELVEAHGDWALTDAVGV